MGGQAPCARILTETSLPFCLKEDINSSDAFTSKTDVLLSLLAAWLYLLPLTASYLPASPGGGGNILNDFQAM